MPWLECVPNISEGRRPAVVATCTEAVRASGATVLDVTSDPSHNRSVLTFAGEPDALRTAVLALFDAAIAAIDLRTHAGVHPRVGAVDVVPFVPLADQSMGEAIDLAHTVARAVSDRHGVPVFLYEEASPAGSVVRRLEDIRRGGLAGLAARMADPRWAPDFGPARPHPTAGVSVIGARRLLIAYNVELATDRIDAARAIARAVRESSGGLPAVKAIGVALEAPGLVQVSMNLTDFRRTSITEAFDAVAREAARLGVGVGRSELVGLAPADALTPAIARHVGLRDFDEDRMILERRLAAARPGRAR